MIPGHVGQLEKAGFEVWIEESAGEAAGFPDKDYTDAGARVTDRAGLRDVQVLLQVRSLGANPGCGDADLELFSPGMYLIGTCDPLGNPSAIERVAQLGVNQFSMELMPRITRAQSMDVLSSMATIAGYRAVLLAASELPRIFPLMMTASGTLAAARVLVIGAGVAGLQAIATARRLGAIVQAYDVRPDCREQVESLGAKFVELDLDAGESEDEGGYARKMDDAFYQRQRELMADVVAENDVVITTAAIPGQPSPLLVTADAVSRMTAGSVIVDLAAERGGNCELSQADERVVEHGVVILGPTNLPAEIPNHASQMFSTNITRFLLQMTENGAIQLNLDDEIIRETLVAHQKDVPHARIRDLLNLPPLPGTEAAREDLLSSGDQDIGLQDLGEDTDSDEMTGADELAEDELAEDERLDNEMDDNEMDEDEMDEDAPTENMLGEDGLALGELSEDDTVEDIGAVDGPAEDLATEEGTQDDSSLAQAWDNMLLKPESEAVEDSDSESDQMGGVADDEESDDPPGGEV